VWSAPEEDFRLKVFLKERWHWVLGIAAALVAEFEEAGLADAAAGLADVVVGRWVEPV
jgi:hypothetical protein